MTRKRKIIIAIPLFLCILGVGWLLFGSCSPIESIRRAYYAPQELISLQDCAPNVYQNIRLTAHRGVNALAPENSLPAYQKAIELGYYSAECDIKQTADGTWVLYHDPFLYSRFLKCGSVADKDINTLKTYPYKSGSAYWNYPDLRITTLDEYLDLFVGSDTRPQIEIKTSRYDSLKSVVDAIRERNLQSSAIIISFDAGQLREIRRYDSDIELWYLCYRITQNTIDEAKNIGNCWLSADCSLNTNEQISLCLSQDVGLSLWTVNSAEKAKELYALGVNYIETDILY